jgi:diguanylate cyclase (GGDEF)-like protein/hemerythrin-like metal-binding protein/PAS domain S-box-containing protein
MARDLNLCLLGSALAKSGVIALAAIRDGHIVFTNPAFRRLFHASGDTLSGITLPDIVTAADRHRLAAAVESARQAPACFVGVGTRGEEPPFDLEVHLETAVLDGEPVVLAFASDVTEQYRARERLAYLAYSDPLTGLPNRTLFFDRLHHAMLCARRDGWPFAVLMADLDGFKAINDSLGHDAGDAVLQQVAQRFRNCIRDTDTMARLGGDEFAVMLPHLENSQVAALVALRMIKALEDPITLGQQHIIANTSIGIAAYPEHAGAIDAVLAAADTALYQTKRAGKNHFRWATPVFAANWSPAAEQTWHEMHNVGIQEIDEQHMHLADLVDQLIAGLRAGECQAVINAAMNQVIDFASLHFSAEERLMARYQIADAAEHRDAHRRLIEDIRNLRVYSEMRDLGLILRYVREWLIRHVDGLDRELGRALAAQGCR